MEIKKIHKINKHINLACGVFTPYPRTEITKELLGKYIHEPKNLKEWTLKEHQKIYTGRYLDKPWQKNKKLMKGISYTIRIAFSDMNNERIKQILTKFQFHYFPDIFLVLLRN